MACSEQSLWWCFCSSRACGVQGPGRTWWGPGTQFQLWSGNWSRRRCSGFGSFTFNMWESVEFLSNHCWDSAIGAFKSHGGRSLAPWNYPCFRWRLNTVLSTHCWGSCLSRVCLRVKKTQFNKINTQKERRSVMFVYIRHAAFQAPAGVEIVGVRASEEPVGWMLCWEHFGSDFGVIFSTMRIVCHAMETVVDEINGISHQCWQASLMQWHSCWEHYHGKPEFGSWDGQNLPWWVKGG